MLKIAKRVGWQLTVVVLDGESVSLMCLLEELHSCVALSWIAIHTPEEAEVGLWNHMYCCPICAYIVKNEITLLDHIIVGHYWGSFSCGRCLAFAVATTAQMRRHIAGCRQSPMEHHKVHSACRKAHWGSKSGCKSRKAKKRTKEGVSAAAWKKPCSSPTESIPTVTSQKQAKKQ